MIDANANRAREAVRTMEDVSRFVLDDRSLCADLKSIRHDLAEALAAFGDAIVHRDTASDVGTTVSTPGELKRESVRSVAVAAGKRLSEALRVIEEASKLSGDGDAVRTIEAIRYRSYQVEQRLIMSIGSANRRAHRLCVVLSEGLCSDGDWKRVAREAIAGGADMVQLREKELSDRELLKRAKTLRCLTREHGVTLIINDRADIAIACEADGVHVGQDDLPIEEMRRVVGFAIMVGVSCTKIEQVSEAHRRGADLVGLGPVFETKTKAHPGGRTDGSVAGLDLIGESVKVDVPALAIGGITSENVHRVWEAGRENPNLGVAVSSAVCGARDVQGAVEALLGAREAVQI